MKKDIKMRRQIIQWLAIAILITGTSKFVMAVDEPLDQKKLNRWLEYVRAVVERYHDRVQYWEIDNEPKISVNYAEVVKAASKVIKKIDPQAKVIAGSIARVNIQAKWLLRRFLVDFSVGIPVNIYFLLREPPENGRVNAKGLLVYDTWEPKVGYRALQHLTSVFDQRLMKPKTVKAEFEVEDEGSFTGIKGEGKELMIKGLPLTDYPIAVVSRKSCTDRGER